MKKVPVSTIVFACIVLVTIIVASVWIRKPRTIENAQIPENNTAIEEKGNGSVDGGNSKYVTDVDMNVNHWKTVETEFFTLKYPKEWYWIESTPKGPGHGVAHVITNNPEFPLNSNEEMGLFAGIGPETPVKIHNDTEFVMAERGVSTMDAGSPENSLNSIFSLAKKNFPNVDCRRLSAEKFLPITALCVAVYPDHQMQQTFYVINKNISLHVSFWTTDTTLLKREVFESIASGLILK